MLEYVDDLQYIIKQSLIGLFSLLFILDKYKYLFINKKTYVDSILDFDFSIKNLKQEYGYSNYQNMRDIDKNQEE